MTGKEDYLAIVDQEEGEQLAISLIEEILTRGQEVLFEKHIESQVLPYAVQFARDTILTIVQWEFFKRDPGDVDLQTWLPDEEPQPAVIDSWSRGAIPVRNQPPPVPAPKKTIETNTPVSTSQVSLLSASAGVPGSVNQSNPKASAVSLGSVKDKKRSDFSINSSSSAAKLGSRMIQRPGSSRRAGAAVGSGEADIFLSPAALAEQAIIEENKKTIARIQNIEKDGGKVDIGYDNDGRVILIRKAIPTKLLTQGVKVKVVSEGTIQAPKPVVANELTSSRLQLLTKSTHGKEEHGNGERKQRVVGEAGGNKKTMSRTTINAGSTSSLNSMTSGSGFVPDTVLDIPLLADTMRLAPGVTLREGDIVKRGAAIGRKGQTIQQAQPQLLQPYTSPSRTTEIVPAIDPILSHVLSKAKPTLRPIPFPGLNTQNQVISDNYTRLPEINKDHPVQALEPLRHAAQAQ
ncbi:hypothetical protein HDU97_001352 [Phlyctochytrium planicorne]|nr:hypothetical protein HDU97_001352 [Phlyctochytrium planicorne]